MFALNIQHVTNVKQAVETNLYDIVFHGDQVFCPMCECLHENNTMCQMSTEGY